MNFTIFTYTYFRVLMLILLSTSFANHIWDRLRRFYPRLPLLPRDGYHYLILSICFTLLSIFGYFGVQIFYFAFALLISAGVWIVDVGLVRRFKSYTGRLMVQSYSGRVHPGTDKKFNTLCNRFYDFIGVKTQLYYQRQYLLILAKFRETFRVFRENILVMPERSLQDQYYVEQYTALIMYLRDESMKEYSVDTLKEKMRVVAVQDNSFAEVPDEIVIYYNNLCSSLVPNGIKDFCMKQVFKFNARELEVQGKDSRTKTRAIIKSAVARGVVAHKTRRQVCVGKHKHLDKFFADGRLDNLQIQVDPSQPEMRSEWSTFMNYLNSNPYLAGVVNKWLAEDNLKPLGLMVERFIIMYFHLKKAKSLKDVYICLLTYYKMADSSKNTVEIIAERAGEAYELFKNLFLDQHEVQSDNLFTKLRTACEQYEDLQNTPFAQKMYKFYLYLLTNSFLDICGVTLDSRNYTKFEQEAMKRKYNIGPSFYHCIIDTLLFLGERGYVLITTGEIEAIFHSGSTYEKWYDDVLQLNKQKHLIGKADGISEFNYLAKLEQTIEKGEAVYKHCFRCKKPEARFVQSYLHSLTLLREDMIASKATRSLRKAPMGILFCSSSKVGKSSALKLALVHFWNVANLQKGKEFVYYVNQYANFLDGIKPYTHTIVMDEVAALRKGVTQEDVSLKYILQFINNMPCTPDQASLENKGKIAIAPELVAATTNVKDLNAAFYYSCASAVRRRFQYVFDVKPKDEYSTNGCLDSTKCPKPVPGEFQDLWWWTVEEVHPMPLSDQDKFNHPKLVKILDQAPLKDFLVWFTEAINVHRENQDRVMKSLDIMHDVVGCDTCKLPENLCICREFRKEEVQADENAVVCTYFIMIETLFKYVFFICSFTRIRRAISNFNALSDMLARLEQSYFTRLYLRPRETIRSLGERAFTESKYPRILLYLTAFLTTSYAMKRIYNMYVSFTEKEVQEDNIEKPSFDGVKPTQGDDERAPVWYKDSYTLSTFDVNNNTISNKGMSDTEVADTIQKNLLHITSVKISADVFRSGKATCITGQVYMTNNHNLVENMDSLIVVGSSSLDGVSPNAQYTLQEEDIYRIPEKDLAFFVLRNAPSRKSIINFFGNEDLQVRSKGMLLSRSKHGFVAINHTKVCSIQRNFQFEDKSRNYAINCDMYSAPTEIRTERGDCGSLLIALSKVGPIILGFHSLGALDQNKSFSIFVTKKDIEKVLIKFKKFTIQSSEPMLSAPSAQHTVSDLHFKSPVRYVEEGVATVYGSLVGFRPKRSSSVSNTLLVPYLSKEGYSIKYCAPPMNSWKPWRRALLDLTNPVLTMNSSVLEVCKQSMLKDILSKLSKSQLNMLEVYDLFTTVNGAPGVSYVDKMPRSTSAGFPWKKCKKHFLTKVPPAHGLQDPVEVSSEILERTQEIITRYKEGRRAMPVYSGNLKDEPITFAKKEISKVRVFCSSPVDHTIAVRQHLLSYTRVAQNNRFIFEAAPGTIAQSYEWSEIYDYLTEFGEDRMVAGDYKAFDKRMPAEVILQAYDIIYELCKASGNYTEDQLMVIQGIAYDTAFPLTDLNGDLIEFHGSNPSGHSLTVHINGLANSLYMRYCYYVLNPKREVASFQDNVKLMTYGDDNIMGVSKKTPWFNHTAIQQVLGDVGITYTMADKEAESIPYIHIKDCSFLKRTWVYDSDIKAYLAPLEHDSIEKMLMIGVESKALEEEERACVVIESALNEYFFYGKETFEEKRKMLLRIAKEANILDVAWKSTFPTWSALAERFWDNSPKSAQALRPSLKNQKSPISTVTVPEHETLNLKVQGKHGCLSSYSQSVPQNPYLGIVVVHNNSKLHCFQMSVGNRRVNSLASINEKNGIPSSSNGTGQDDEQQQFHMVDETKGEVVGQNVRIPSTFNSKVSRAAGFTSFLERPVLIKTITWPEGTRIVADAVSRVNPWYEFFNHPAIKKKIDNFYLVRCKLHLKIMINASQFYYGLAMASYRPLLISDAGGGQLGDGQGPIVGYSQRPCVYLSPGENKGGEITLPFIYHKTWLDITSAADLIEMGELQVLSVTDLLNANSVSGTGSTIRIMAWATDMEIHTPTVNLAVQSDDQTHDEYKKSGIISKPASAVAEFMGGMGDWPVIGEFCTASSIVAKGVSSVASWFGFTNVPVIDDVAPYKSLPFHAFSSAEISEPIDKLTFDPKNEVTIDNRVTGYSADDELCITNFVGREAIIGDFNWPTTGTLDQMLFCSRVVPWMAVQEGGFNALRMMATPMALASTMFKYWRGDIVYRFRIIKSPYHKGRIKITWDPTGDIQAVTDTNTTNLTKIVDIAEEDDFIVRIPYSQPTDYLSTKRFNNIVNFGSTSCPARVPGEDNGLLTVRVFTELTTANAIAPVKLVVSVYGADNFEFQNPVDLEQNFSVYDIQSYDCKLEVQGDDYYDKPRALTEYVMGDNPPEIPRELSLIYSGEKVVSFRTLLRRSSLSRVITLPNDTTSNWTRFFSNMSRYPLYYGYDPEGVNTALSLIAGPNAPFNYSNNIPFNILGACFVGSRGAVHWHFNMDTPEYVNTLVAKRNSFDGLTIGNYYATRTATYVSPDQMARDLIVGTRNPGAAGMSLVNQKTQTGLSVAVPYYSKYRLRTNSTSSRTLGRTNDDSNADLINVSGCFVPVIGENPRNTNLYEYFSVGTDFNFIHFLNVPPLYEVSNVPNAA